MYCQFCGREIADGSESCSYCGKRLVSKPSQKGMYDHDLTKLKAPAEIKNPKVASLLGFLLGWIFLGPVGYIYLGQWNWFWIMMVLQVFAYSLTSFFGLFILFPFGGYMLLPFIYAVHQYDMAKKVNLLVDTAESEGGGAQVAGPEE